MVHKSMYVVYTCVCMSTNVHTYITSTCEHVHVCSMQLCVHVHVCSMQLSTHVHVCSMQLSTHVHVCSMQLSTHVHVCSMQLCTHVHACSSSHTSAIVPTLDVARVTFAMESSISVDTSRSSEITAMSPFKALVGI